jgi:hypothetical protein
VARGRLALDIVAERLKLIGVPARELRFDLIGLDAIHGSRLGASGPAPYEVRARVAGRTDTLDDAIRIGNEVEALYTNGPAAGGGVAKSAREIVAMVSALLPRDRAIPAIRYLES